MNEHSTHWQACDLLLYSSNPLLCPRLQPVCSATVHMTSWGQCLSDAGQSCRECLAQIRFAMHVGRSLPYACKHQLLKLTGHQPFGAVQCKVLYLHVLYPLNQFQAFRLVTTSTDGVKRRAKVVKEDSHFLQPRSPGQAEKQAMLEHLQAARLEHETRDLLRNQSKRCTVCFLPVIVFHQTLLPILLQQYR